MKNIIAWDHIYRKRNMGSCLVKERSGNLPDIGFCEGHTRKICYRFAHRHEGAFDSDWWPGILKRLKDINVAGAIMTSRLSKMEVTLGSDGVVAAKKWIKDILRARYFAHYC